MSLIRSLSLVVLSTVALPAFAATYEVDASHTRVGFGVQHMMMNDVRGEFGAVTGKVEFDPANIAATKINAVVGITSLDTREPKRDDHLRSPDFFDVANFPTMTFASKSVKNIAADGFDVVGDLTIHGVTKEVTLRVAPFSKELKDPWGNTKIATHATGVINRQDFGLKWNKTLDAGGYLVGDLVKIELDVELARK